MSDQPVTTSGVQEQKALDTAAPVTELEVQREQAAEDFSQEEEKGQISMHVKVYSPYKDYYNGKAFSISAENATGPFDILPRHHNFISLLIPSEVTIRTVGKGDRKLRISGGLMHVKADQVIVFLDV